MSKDHVRILLIEDDSADYQLIARCLRRSRMSQDLTWCQNLTEGLSQLDTAQFDIVLSDLTLPESRGLETVTRIRNHAPSVPIIVLTTLDNHEIECTAFIAGAQDYMLKNEVTPDILGQAIVHAIQREGNVNEIQRLLTEVKLQREVLVEQKRLLKCKNQRLRKLYKTAYRFVDNVSHEFRTPLTVIKDYVSLVREGIVGPVTSEQRRMLDIANVRTDDLNNMVDDMLDLSKLESGLLGIWRRPCRFGSILESVCGPLHNKAAIKGIDFAVDIAESLPDVYCDADKAGRVIINLVTNALKFCGDPGSVRLWAKHRKAESDVMIGVTDNGDGIEDADLAEIFKRFRQLKTDIKSSTKGFGLGLSIAKELVGLNLGELSVESQNGAGTTFTFTVPVNDPLAVMTRFLKRSQRMNTSEYSVALVSVRIDRSESLDDADGADAFFNYLLRRNDLLFRLDSHRWLFLLPIPNMEKGDFLSRAEAEWVKTNRNRPLGPLPKFHTTVDGAWCVHTRAEEIMAQFSKEVRQEMVFEKRASDRCRSERETTPEFAFA